MLQEGLAVLQQHPHKPGVELLLLQKQLIMTEMIMIVIEMIMMMKNVCCRNAALQKNTKSF